MKVEHIRPGSIEGYRDLETEAQESRQYMQEELDRMAAADEPLMDEELEMQSLSMLKCTDALARVLFADLNVDGNDAISTAHRAFYFGLLLGQELRHSKELDVDLTVLKQFDGLEEVKEYIELSAASYLQHREAINGLISRYAIYISPLPQLQSGAEAITAFTLARVEQGHFDDFINGEAALLSEHPDLQNRTEE